AERHQRGRRLLQLKYSRHRMQPSPTRPFDGSVYEDIDD
ncbi:unnamed protein product, partial [Tetraodon nigroviridis]